MSDTNLSTAASAGPHNLPEYTVSTLSGALKRTVEDNFGRVRVRGEISGLKQAASGHVYLTLKDDKAVLDGVIWRGVAGGLRFRPEDGLEVVCEGKLTTYPARSRYQLVIERMEPAGVGALLALLDERRKKLAAEGLFEPARKQHLPFLPERIGVITSPTGAVIRDILHRLADRFPRDVLLWPVRVQGDGAAEEIAAAIRGFNGLAEDGPVARPDLLIVARGGGSIEDLWAFNEEIVVRAAAESDIPLISAVGHETDTTLIDYASDKRAPTPTAAAEIAVPVRADLIVTLSDLDRQRLAAMNRRLNDGGALIQSLARGLPRPDALLGEAIQRLDDRTERLRNVGRTFFEIHRRRLADAGGRLKSPAEQIATIRGRLAGIAAGLAPAIKSTMTERHHRLDRALGDRRLPRAVTTNLTDANKRLVSAGQLLESYSYENVLRRGFAVVRDQDGKVIKTATTAPTGDPVTVRFIDGEMDALLSEKSTRLKRTPPKSSRRKPPSSDDQGQLF